jgi:hypothetical protein
LVDGLKREQSYMRAYVHLSPTAKANKTLVYYKANKAPIKITDRGDVMNLTWRFNNTTWENIDLE